VNEHGLCNQERDDTVHTGWTNEAAAFPPLHDFTTEAITTEKYRELTARLAEVTKERDEERARAERIADNNAVLLENSADTDKRITELETALSEARAEIERLRGTK
jgi:septal ring factor EnvC (AmiA/AmiB activator)